MNVLEQLKADLAEYLREREGYTSLARVVDFNEDIYEFGCETCLSRSIVIEVKWEDEGGKAHNTSIDMSLAEFLRHVSGESANATAQQCESCGGTAEPFRKINGVGLCFDCWAKWGTVDEEEE